MNGGVLRISFTGDVRPRRMIPNRWLSVPRPRRPCSSTQRREFVVLISLRLGLKGYAAESTPPHPRCRRDKGRSTEAEGDGDVRRFLLSEFQHRRLDKTFSIDASLIAPACVARRVLAVPSYRDSRNEASAPLAACNLHACRTHLTFRRSGADSF